jgi:hypothetical protein
MRVVITLGLEVTLFLLAAKRRDTRKREAMGEGIERTVVGKSSLPFPYFGGQELMGESGAYGLYQLTWSPYTSDKPPDA